jgi:hypothetical protein
MRALKIPTIIEHKFILTYFFGFFNKNLVEYQYMLERVELLTEAKFSNYLSSFGIPVNLWGQGTAKTIGHLLQEVSVGETVLTTKGRELLRQVGFSAVHVTYRDGREVYELVEYRQEFRDGRVRRRNTGASISEKLQPGENPKDAAERALQEELGISGGVNLKGGKITEELKESPSYPGLRTQYLRYDFNAELRPDQYSPEGYVEEQDDKTTYFVWRKR